MRKVVRDIFEMADDEAISDKNFRRAIKRIAEENGKRCNLRKGIIAIIAEMRQEAIYETERDLYVR